MRRWLTRPCPVPRWLLLAIIALSTAAFLLLYAQTRALFSQAITLSVQLQECLTPAIIDYLDPPFLGALGHLPQVQAGLACTLLVIAAAAWGVCRGRRSTSPGSDRQAGALPPGAAPPSGEQPE